MKSIFCDKQFIFVTVVILLAAQACTGSPSAPTGPASTSPSGEISSLTSTWTVTVNPTELPTADAYPVAPTAAPAANTQLPGQVNVTQMPEPEIIVTPTVAATDQDDYFSSRY